MEFKIVCNHRLKHKIDLVEQYTLFSTFLKNMPKPPYNNKIIRKAFVQNK